MKHWNTEKSEFFIFIYFLIGKGWVEFGYIIFGLNGFFFFFLIGKCWIEFGDIIFGLNGAQWVFS